MWSTRLNNRLTELGWSKAELARRSGVSYDNINKYARGEVEKPRGHIMELLADALGVDIAWLRDGTHPEKRNIPVVGYVGAGEVFTPLNDFAPGDGLKTLSFNLNQDHYIAVMVRGDSMSPVYRDGDSLICQKISGRAISSVINKDCVVLTKYGEGFVKIVKRGHTPGRFTLRSYNPAFDDIEDQELRWAAPILWVRRS